MTNRGEVVCLDTEGFYDGVDNGPVQNELGRLFEYVKNEDPAKDKVARLLKDLEAGKIPDALRTDFAKAGMPLPDDAKLAPRRAATRSLLPARERSARSATADGRPETGRLQSDRHRRHRRGRRHLAAEHDEAARQRRSTTWPVAR